MMKLRGDNFVERWLWEESGKVVVFSSCNEVENQKSEVIKYIKEMLQEFSIPLNVIDGNLEYSGDLCKIIELFPGEEIIGDDFGENILKVREKGELQYGLIILLDRNKYLPIIKRGKEEKDIGIYGYGDEDGFIILRATHKEAVRHEFAHMLGLCYHHDPEKPECIMNWECPTPIFCDECKQRIINKWTNKTKNAKNKRNTSCMK